MKTGIKPTRNAEAVGSSMAGMIRCEFDVLQENLGTPIRHGPISCSWNLSLRLADGLWVVFTVYNYKDKNPPEKNEMWHVGSHHINDDAIFSFLERVLRCDVIQKSW